jgi:hypothetical protein
VFVVFAARFYGFLFEDAPSLTAVVGMPCATHCRYLGRYGNSSQTASVDWVRILNSDQIPGQEENANSGDECVKVLTGIHLEILTSSIGAQENPQKTIIGSRWVFKHSAVRFYCTGTYCNGGSPDATQRFQQRFSVGFVDVTLPAGEVVKIKPDIVKKLPHDFFYPFA